MKQKLKSVLFKTSTTLSVIAFMLLGYLLGSLNDGNQSNRIALGSLILALFAIRIATLIKKVDRRSLLREFYQWMFELSVILMLAAYQQTDPVYFAVFMGMALVILVLLFLVVFSKLFS
jgi:hypothetical protein